MELEDAIVYILDDDPSVRRSLERLARSAGFEARGFATAAEFLAAQRERRPACLILDLLLPDMRGLDVQRQLTLIDPGLHVVVLTGYGDDRARREALAGGAVAFLSKPCDDEELLDAIRRALSGSPAGAGR